MHSFNFSSFICVLAITASGCGVGGAAVDDNGNTVEEARLKAGTPEFVASLKSDPAAPASWTAVPVDQIVGLPTTEPVENPEILPAATDMLITPITPSLHSDEPRMRLLVQLVDKHHKALGDNLPVEAFFTGNVVDHASKTYARCVTDKDGSCAITWDVPESAFDQGGTLGIDLVAKGMQARVELPVFATPDALAITKPGAGWQLPTAPRTEGSTFDVPLYIETHAAPGAYDVALNFDPSQLAVTKVTYGACTAFGTPINNVAQGANTTGNLKVIGLNGSQTAGCVSEERVHVATVQFEVLEGAAGNEIQTSSPMSCSINALIDVNFAQVAKGKACDFGDASGTDTVGEVLIQPAL